MNLLNNSFDAVKTVKDKTVALEISAHNHKIQFSVIDSGPGVKEENIPKIMEPFFTTKEIGLGTGLGLSIAKGIAEEHQGNLFYNQKLLKTCFVLELPIWH